MKQIELRLALVLYGGVSLAVYMHGITREFLGLVRASRRLEARGGAHDAGLAGRAGGPPDPTNDNRLPPPGLARDSVAAYEAFLGLLRPQADLRVVVDVIAGASAGGVNGVMLARALAHNLSLDSHRDLWLENADVTRLAGEPAGITRYLKGSLAPVLDRLVSVALKAELSDPETRGKLRQFMQARWFKPPFSGERYVGWMLDACRAMHPAGPSGAGEPATLIPQGQALDLFVTVTDFHGARRRFPIGDGVDVEETEHRRILRYGARRRGNGDMESDFTDAAIPDLVFSARATSSFPGAFPPMTVAEMDRVLAARGETWPHRDAFLLKAFADCDGDPAARVLVDGSVVMNKPFQPVLDAISGRPAAREVVRRIVYVDPLVAMPTSAGGAVSPSARLTAADVAGEDGPGFFRVILASLAHIPRNEPIGDALEQVAAYNRETTRVAEVIAAAEPVVEREVRAILRSEGDRPLTVQELTRCREMANERAHVFAGYASHGYQRLKLSGIVERVADLAGRLAVPGRGRSAERQRAAAVRAVARSLDAWLADRRTGPAAAEPGASGLVFSLSGVPSTPPAILTVLRGLDVDYRVRRLRFVIRRLNALYRGLRPEMAVNPEAIDELKNTLYEQVDHLSRRWSAAFYGAETRALSQALVASAQAGEEATPAAVEAFVACLSARMGLADLDRLADDIFSVMAFNYMPEPLRQSLNTAYLGFAFYDLVTLPVLGRAMVSEYNEVRVERISPAEGNGLRPQGVTLKGRSLNAFGAFFNRRWREHDYLWGRLTAADRLMTIAAGAVSGIVTVAPADLAAARGRVFRAILAEEAPHLLADPALVPGLLAEVERVFAAQRTDAAASAAPAGPAVSPVRQEPVGRG